MRHSLRLFLLALLILPAISAAAAPPPSDQQKAAAQKHHKAGVESYLAGRYEEAIRELEKAFALDPDPLLLFNLGQAHRKNGSPGKAISYYTRYLAAVPNAPDQAEVENRIRELERNPNGAAVKDEDAQLKPAPVAEVRFPVPPPPPPPLRAQSAIALQTAAPAAADESLQTEHRPFRVLLALGMAYPRLAGSNINSSNLVAVGISAAYGWELVDEKRVDVALSASWSPLPYDKFDANAMKGTGEKGRSDLVTTSAGVSLHLPVGDHFTLGPTVGLGILWWTGLEKDNPFAGGEVPSGAVPLPTARAGLSAIWGSEAGPFLGLDVGASYSKTSGALAKEATGLLRIEGSGVVGLGF